MSTLLLLIWPLLLFTIIDDSIVVNAYITCDELNCQLNCIDRQSSNCRFVNVYCPSTSICTSLTIDCSDTCHEMNIYSAVSLSLTMGTMSDVYGSNFYCGTLTHNDSLPIDQDESAYVATDIDCIYNITGRDNTVSCLSGVSNCDVIASSGTNMSFYCDTDLCQVTCGDSDDCKWSDVYISNGAHWNCAGNGCDGATVHTYAPTNAPTDVPTHVPTNMPSIAPSNLPTNAPTDAPTDVPSNTPTNVPTSLPTSVPTGEPTDEPSDGPTYSPTDVPTSVPTDVPSAVPTNAPTDEPTDEPSYAPTDAPTDLPTDMPTDTPNDQPSDAPTDGPTIDDNSSEVGLNNAAMGGIFAGIIGAFAIVIGGICLHRPSSDKNERNKNVLQLEAVTTSAADEETVMQQSF